MGYVTHLLPPARRFNSNFNRIEDEMGRHGHLTSAVKFSMQISSLIIIKKKDKLNNQAAVVN